MLLFNLSGLKTRLRHKNWIIVLIIFSLLLLPKPIIAGAFKVVPVKLHLDSKKSTTSIRIINQGEEEVTLQLDAKEWSQNDMGADIYQQTKDIVFFPKIATIEKGEERIIRIGYQKKADAKNEKTYRLFLEELPVAKPGETSLRFALRMVVPIFISPLKEIRNLSIENVQFSEGKISVKVKNNGNVHSIVGKLSIAGIDRFGRKVFNVEGRGWYVLLGAAKTFELEIPEEKCIKAEKMMLAVEVDRDTLKKTLNFEQIQCGDGKDDEKDAGGQSGN